MIRTDYAPFLQPLLRELNWTGTSREQAESLPLTSDKQALTAWQLRDTLARLGFSSRIARNIRLNKRLANDVPLLFIVRRGEPRLYVTADQLPETTQRGLCISFNQDHTHLRDTDDAIANGRTRLLQRFYPLIGQVVVISLLIGVLALAPAFYSIALYDHVLASGSAQSLVALLSGVGLAFGAELTLRAMRNRRLSYFGSRLDHIVNCSVFERLLFLPPAVTEKASVSAQLARLRDFEAVREFLSGPLSSLFFELPLVAVYIALMVVLSGSLALVPIALVLAYTGLLFAMQGRLKDASRQAANAASKRQEFLLEMLTKLPAIRLCGLEQVWQQRYRTLSKEATLAGFRTGYAAQLIEVYSYLLMSVGAMATLVFGVHEVIKQNMTTGALVAAMMLVWRIVAPLQVCCASISRLQQLQNSTQQVQRLLAMPTERNPTLAPLKVILKGQITFSRVTLRYTTEAEPALLGVSFDIKAGQVIAIRGANGSGKSSILKLILGLYAPQGGAIRLDGMDLRQFDPLALRQAIAYVPQAVDFIPGTIRDNLGYVAPEAGEDDYWDALQLACAADEVRSLSHGLDTIISGSDAETIPFLLQQRLNLARAYVQKAAIILCDEASQSLGKDNDDAFTQMINTCRGQATVILVTHREDHLRLADQIFMIDKGELVSASIPVAAAQTLKRG